jgi:hypothetical protein
MTVYWNSFIDVEEGGKIAHSSGVAGYEVAIGTLEAAYHFSSNIKISHT